MDSISQTFVLRVLGPPSLTDGTGTVPPSLGWGKPLALLCLLAVRKEVPRDEVVDLLWRGIEESRARNAFRQALHRLRSALGSEIIPQHPERLRLEPRDRLAIDLTEFESAAAAGELDRAISTYCGDFLEGASVGEPAFDIWADQQRARLRARFHQILLDAIGRAEADGRWPDAITLSRRLLASSPLDATAARTGATILLSAGRRVEALELLRQFAARLQSELGLPLPPELQQLATRMEKHADAAAPGRTESAPPVAPLAMVGREAELTRLLSLWRSTGDDAGAMVLVEGVSGIGKSRLVRELIAHARTLGPALVLTGREHAFGAQAPFGVFADALRPVVRAPGILGASRHLLAEAARLLPELRDITELPTVSDVEDETARVRFFEGIAALLDAAAYEQPLLLVLEDLQYVGPSSLDLLTYLSARLAGSAVMFVNTLRADDAPEATVARLRSLAAPVGAAMPPHAERALHVRLAALTDAQTRELVQAHAARAGVAPEVAGQIIPRVEGIPGRVDPLLRRVAAGDMGASLPVSPRELAADRLQRLTSSERRLFLVITLLGRPADTHTIAAAAHLSDHALAESLAALASAGLITLEDGDVVAWNAAASVAIESAGAPTRAFLSGWIAEALEHDPRASAAELSMFYATAGQTDRAFHHARRAAFAALAMGAVGEAVGFLNSARTFATTDTQVGEIESALASLGAGRRRIGHGSDREVEAPGATGDADARRSTPSGQTAAYELPAEGRWLRLFPNWRLLLGGAIATLLISAFVLWNTPAAIGSGATFSSTDTLIVGEGAPTRTVRFITGDLVSGFTLSGPVDAGRSDPAWADSLSRPWSAPLVSPRAQHVAVARVTANGSALTVITADRRDTLILATSPGDARPLAWSPDGRWVLGTVARAGAGGGFDTDLYAYRVDEPREVRIIDSLTDRSVVEAAWSPDGSRVAWVARVGAERQLDVFVSRSDGTQVRNVSDHPADDQHISWSSDGDLLAFTSTRDGNAELYAAGMVERRIWRLTRDPAQDDGGRFFAGGRLIAFESTRGGTAGVYVMPALGGEPRRLGGDLPLTLLGRRGGGGRYVDRIRVRSAGPREPGDTATLAVLAFDQFGDSIGAHEVTIEATDDAARLVAPRDPVLEPWRLVALRRGVARVVATVGRWRFDTADVLIGSAPIVFLDAALRDPLQQWIALGSPRPGVSPRGPGMITLAADRDWESGLLSRVAAPLLPGLRLRAALDADSAAAGPAASISVAVVAPEARANVDDDAPQFLRYASFTWSAEAARLIYSVGSEVFTEPSRLVSAVPAIEVEIVVERDSTASFLVNGQRRWRSTLRLVHSRNESRAQLWVGARATGSAVHLREAAITLAPPVNTP